jgi:hypothetical protein
MGQKRCLACSGCTKQYIDINGKYSITHQYHAWAAWENPALEEYSRVLVTNGMKGFGYESASADLSCQTALMLWP